MTVLAPCTLSPTSKYKMHKNVRVVLMRTSFITAPPPKKCLIAFSPIAWEIRSLAVSGRLSAFLGDWRLVSALAVYDAISRESKFTSKSWHSHKSRRHPIRRRLALRRAFLVRSILAHKAALTQKSVISLKSESVCDGSGRLLRVKNAGRPKNRC